MAYRFISIGGSEEDRWKWFSWDRTKLQVELRMATDDELEEMRERFRIGKDNPDEAGYRRFIAENCWRDFKGAYDAHGTPIENSLDSRIAMLNDRAFRNWLIVKLMDFVAWGLEGNAASGSAS